MPIRWDEHGLSKREHTSKKLWSLTRIFSASIVPAQRRAVDRRGELVFLRNLLDFARRALVGFRDSCIWNARGTPGSLLLLDTRSVCVDRITVVGQFWRRLMG